MSGTWSIRTPCHLGTMDKNTKCNSHILRFMVWLLGSYLHREPGGCANGLMYRCIMEYKPVLTNLWFFSPSLPVIYRNAFLVLLNNLLCFLPQRLHFPLRTLAERNIINPLESIYAFIFSALKHFFLTQ